MVDDNLLQGIIDGVKDLVEVLVGGEENPVQHLSERCVELTVLSRLLGVSVEIPLYPIFLQTPVGTALGGALLEHSQQEGENPKIVRIEIALFSLFCGERVLNGVLAREFAAVLSAPDEAEIPRLLSEILGGPTEGTTLDPTSGERDIAYEELYDLLPGLTSAQDLPRL